MKWVHKIQNAKMIAFSQFPIGAELFIVVTPQSVRFLDMNLYSGEMGDKYLGMDVRAFVPGPEDTGIPAVLIGSDANRCLAVSVLWDGAIIVADTE